MLYSLIAIETILTRLNAMIKVLYKAYGYIPSKFFAGHYIIVSKDFCFTIAILDCQSPSV